MSSFCEYSNNLARWTNVDGEADDIQGLCENGATWTVGNQSVTLHVCFRHIGHAAAILKAEGHTTVCIDYADSEVE